MLRPEWHKINDYQNEAECERQRKAWMESLSEPKVFSDKELEFATRIVNAVLDISYYHHDGVWHDEKEDILKALRVAGWEPLRAAIIFDQMKGASGDVFEIEELPENFDPLNDPIPADLKIEHP